MSSTEPKNAGKVAEVDDVGSTPSTKKWLALAAALSGFLLGAALVAVLDKVARAAGPKFDAVAQTESVVTLKPVVTEASLTGDWPQWGGTPQRNNVPIGQNIPIDWDIGGFDRKTRQWQSEKARNIGWVAPVGSQTYGNPVVADRQIYVGTNNGAGYLARYPADVDLGCLLAFGTDDGSFLWQHSSEKLSTGRVHDWPRQGICCAPLVERDRLWFVSSRGLVVCLDTKGFYDGEDDGPVEAGLVTLFKESPDLDRSLAQGTLSPAFRELLLQAGVPVANRVRVKKIEEKQIWELEFRVKKDKLSYVVNREGDSLVVRSGKHGEEGDTILATPVALTAGLDEGSISPALRALLMQRGMEVGDDAKANSVSSRQWQVSANINGRSREIEIGMQGPNLIARKRITIDDLEEADVVWSYDMMAELGVSQHNMCSCSVTAHGDILFVNTSNGVDESHINIPNVKAPSFMAMNKQTGEVYWTDNSPKENILHGQWSSPTVAVIGGEAQVIFGGGDGWVYSFRADEGSNGQGELLWKFDANPKTSEWILGGRGTRNNIIATPVVYKDQVYVAMGQDPEHGEGIGHVWCIDPTRRGDVSPELAVHVDDRTKPIPHRRLQAVVERDGELAIDNPNSAAIWHYKQFDQNGDGEFQFEESMHRSCGTVAIKDDLLYIADFSGLFHCLDAMTGKVHWTYDMLASAWGSPLIVDGKVYIGDEDGDVVIFRLTSERHDPMAELNMANSVYSTPIVSHNVLYISNKTHLFAISADASK
jgi:outer membrane protein assembly factor BamB